MGRKANAYERGFKMKKIGNIIFLIFVVIISTAYYFDVSGLPDIEERIYVYFLYWALLILILIEIVKNIKEILAEKNEDDTNIINYFKGLSILKNKQIILGGSLVIYVVMTQYIGFFISSFMYFIGLTYFLGTRGIKGVIVVPAGLCVVIYILFVSLLGINLPQGLII